LIFPLPTRQGAWDGALIMNRDTLMSSSSADDTRSALSPFNLLVPRRQIRVLCHSRRRNGTLKTTRSAVVCSSRRLELHRVALLQGKTQNFFPRSCLSFSEGMTTTPSFLVSDSNTDFQGNFRCQRLYSDNWFPLGSVLVSKV